MSHLSFPLKDKPSQSTCIDVPSPRVTLIVVLVVPAPVSVPGGLLPGGLLPGGLSPGGLLPGGLTSEGFPVTGGMFGEVSALGEAVGFTSLGGTEVESPGVEGGLEVSPPLPGKSGFAPLVGCGTYEDAFGEGFAPDC